MLLPRVIRLADQYFDEVLCRIPPVRHDVVDNGRYRHPALPPAPAAKAVFRLAQEGGARLVPAAVIAALSRRGAAAPGAIFH
jgi:hypothetical protein